MGISLWPSKETGNSHVEATHKLNRWKHNMFSFLVRDEQGTWVPVAHCRVEREDGRYFLKHCGVLKSGALVGNPLRHNR